MKPLIHDSRLFSPIQSFQFMIKDMFDTMYAYNAVGLAANQVGYGSRIFVMDCGDNPRSFIEPVIEHSEGLQVAKEGCVSFPSRFVEVERAEIVVVSGVRLEGLEARVAQHEIDHLNGITILEYE